MSHENAEIVMRGYRHYIATGDFLVEDIGDGYVWDMSTFAGWPEKQVYEGLEGAREFMRDWLEQWDDWSFDVLDVASVEDRVLTVVRQRGRAKGSGVEAEMLFAQLWTLRDGKIVRVSMYASPEEGRRALARDG